MQGIGLPTKCLTILRHLNIKNLKINATEAYETRKKSKATATARPRVRVEWHKYYLN